MGKGLPSFDEMVHNFGPYLGLVLSLCIGVLVLQFIWFSRMLRAKNAEIERLIRREEILHDRLLYKIDAEIGYSKKK